MTEEDEYLLGTGAVELARLELQHNIWNSWTERLLELAAFAPSGRLLDLGAGPGFTTRSLAQRAPEATIVALDTSPRFAAHLRHLASREGLRHVSFQQCDVHSLPLEASSCDGALARWLFCFLREPEQVVAELARVLRPGARLAILDYFNYLAVGFQPPAPELGRVFQAVHKSFAEHGGSLDICGILPGLLSKHGFQIAHLLPICEVSRPREPFWRWFRAFRDSYFERLVEGGQLSAAELAAFDSTFAAREQDPGAFFFTPPMLGIVAIRGD